MAHGDDEFLSAFLRNQSEIRRYLTRMTGSQEDAEDIAQEAWIKLVRNRATVALPIPYLKRIVRSLAIDHDRSRRRKLTVDDVDRILSVPDERPDPEREVEDRDQITCLMRILDELPERRRHILVAARLEQRSHADIARQFSVTTRTVEFEIRKALDYCGERLRQINSP